MMGRVARWVGVVSVLALGLWGGHARAAISTQSAWASQFAGTTTYPNGTVNASYAVAAGSGRLLVVAISATSAATGAITCSATYGGQALTLAAGDGPTTTTWNHSFLFYLMDTPAVMDGTGRALAATCSGGTAYATWVYAAVYAGVDQTTPITDARNYNSGATADTAVGPFNPTLTIGANDQAIEIVNLAGSAVGTTPRTISTWATGWTTAGVAPASIATNGPTATMYIRDRNLLTAAADGSQHTANSASTWDSMTAMSMKVAPTLAVTAGTMPPAASPPAGSSGTIVGRVFLTAAGNTVTLGSLAISNTGTALPSMDVGTLSLFNDASGAFVGAGVWNAATSHYEFKGLGLAVAVGSPITLRVVLGLNIGATVGRTFIMNMNVPADVAVVSPSTVSNSATIAGNIFTAAAGLVAGSTNPAAPMVSIINPADGKVVSPNNQYKVQIRVFNPTAQGGIAGITSNSVALSTDNGTTWPSIATRNSNYDSGTPTVTGTVYEVFVTGQAPGSYTLRARASNGVVANVVSEPVSIVVGAPLKGDGNLLVRDNSSQLCSDCHALPTHSSEAIFAANNATKYGSWAVACRDCHSPHGTRNIMLVNETVTPPSASGTIQTAKNVGFVTMTGDSNAAGWDATNKKPTPTGSFANSDNTGPCQVCHTRTQSAGAVARWRNTGNVDSHYTSGSGTLPCTGCHSHKGGFAAGESSGGVDCNSCHAGIFNPMNGTGNHHHYMNNAWSGSTAGSNTTTYPTPASLGGQADTNRRCLMCHVDHDVFRPDLNPTSGGRGKNLRTGLGVAVNKGAGTGFTNSDYVAGAGGICISCHATSQTKSYADPDGTTATPVVTTAEFGGGAHDYNVASAFKNDGLTNTFNANCSKCHGDANPAVFQTSTARFQLHDSPLRSMTAPLGIAGPTDPLEEKFCYRCHSTTANAAAIGGTTKPAANNDWYGAVTTMSAASQDVYDQMQKGTAGSAGGAPTTATNTLYFKAGTEETPAGTLPTAHLSTTDTFAGGTFVARSMSPYAPTVAYETRETATFNIATGTQNWRRVSFISPTVATGFTTSAAAWTINIYDRESSANANARVRYAVYTIDSAGALKSSIVARANFGTEMGTTAAPGTQQVVATAAGSAVAVAAGDRIVVDLEVQTLTVTTAVTGGTIAYYFGSGAESRVVMPNTVTFNYTSQPTPASARHDVGTHAGRHRPNPAEETRAYIASNKHVECVDCHDPHAARAGLHTKGSAALAPVLTGASGVGVTTWGTNWTGVASANFNPSATTAPLIAATAEWQVCFKCHSSANANVATWGGTGAAAFTDLALEFNPNNESYHPVIQALPATGNRRLAAAALTGGWVPGQVMNCSDCHGTDSTAASQGPHGSSVKWMLDPNTTGTKNYNWPYTTAAGNGTSTGTLLTGTGATTVPTANFCLSCHVWGEGGPAHVQQGGNHSMACAGCHIRVPHGGKALRLLNGPASPARYKSDGNGAGTVYMNGGSRPASGAMQPTNCQAAGGCVEHAATGTLLGW